MAEMDAGFAGCHYRPCREFLDRAKAALQGKACCPICGKRATVEFVQQISNTMQLATVLDCEDCGPVIFVIRSDWS
jgi:hypothetical protein